MNNNMLLRRGAQLLLIVAVFFLGWYAGQASASPATSSQSPAASQTAAAETATLMIDYGNGTVVSIPNVALPQGATVYDALKSATERKGIALESKDYGGELGQFIQSIGGKQGSGDAYWQYWVNGIYSQKGVSGVVPAPGDVIEFKLTKGQQGQ